jgi:DNA-binding NtrC family response regulator
MAGSIFGKLHAAGNGGFQGVPPEGDLWSCDMSTKRGTILVVDDEEAVRALISIVLKDDGHRVLLAGDYEEAIAVQQQHRGELDLLLTDVDLGGRSGRELATAALGVQPELKVLYMSGSPGSEIFPSQGRPPRGSGFLAKPFHSAQLRDHVNRMLEEHVRLRTSLSRDSANVSTK